MAKQLGYLVQQNQILANLVYLYLSNIYSGLFHLPLPESILQIESHRRRLKTLFIKISFLILSVVVYHCIPTLLDYRFMVTVIAHSTTKTVCVLSDRLAVAYSDTVYRDE